MEAYIYLTERHLKSNFEKKRSQNSFNYCSTKNYNELDNFFEIVKI